MPPIRTNSAYVDAPETRSEGAGDATQASEGGFQHATPSHTALNLSDRSTAQTPEPGEGEEVEEEEEDEDDEDNGDGDGDDDVDDEEDYDDEGESQEEEEEYEAMGEEYEEDIEDQSQADEEFVMQVDPTTGLRRATSLAHSSVRARSSSVTNRLRRQQRRMNTSARSGATARSSASRPSSGGPGDMTTRPSASTVPLVDEKAQSELRRKIMDIQRDPTISFGEKAAMIQKLMSPKSQDSQKASEHQTTEGASATTDEDLRTTYYNDVLGCKHYKRGCKLQANCCGKWFNCRFCHDDICDHVIIRNETKTMLCMHCKSIQPAAQSCNSCQAKLAQYYCDVCKLWDDDAAKSIYHCDDCGICRIGNGLGNDFFHCKKCNICMNIQLQDNHKCIERNLECDCPICGEYMFTSTTTVIFMPCGHCIHSKCHEEYVKTSYQCPTCWKALGDMSAYYSKINSLLAEQTMPPEYASIFSIVLCNDCEVKSEAPYHFLYHKCDKCKGYNTKVLETFKRVSEGQVQVVENATAAGAAGTVPENNISGGSGSAGSSSSSAAPVPSSGSDSATIGSSNTAMAPVHLPDVPRSPLLDGNASGETVFGHVAGSSGNSAP